MDDDLKFEKQQERAEKREEKRLEKELKKWGVERPAYDRGKKEIKNKYPKFFD